MELTQAQRLRTRNPDEDLLGRFFAEFLDEASFADFRRAERLIDSLKLQETTVSGYPKVRPRDCAKVLQQLEKLYGLSLDRLRVDDLILSRFRGMLSDFAEFTGKIYPNEAVNIKLFQAKVCLFVGDAQGALELTEHYFRRPYALEGNFSALSKVVDIFVQANLRLGTFDSLNVSFIAFSRWLAAQSMSAFVMNWFRLIRYIAITPLPADCSFLDKVIRWCAQRYMEVVNGRGTVLRFVLAWFEGQLLSLLLLLLTLGTSHRRRFRSPYSDRSNRKGGTFVSRAMGGIGDLLMMEPGLEALAAKQGRKVDFAIPRKFHAIFRHNPHVNLIDIDGPPIDISRYRRWVNLGDCPAGRYENRARPKVRRGRVQLFAAAMGVGVVRLRRQGWRVRMYLSDEDREFCAHYKSGRGLGSRPIVGIQPYSRDSYKDHPRITAIIRAIAEHYDIIIFHHVSDGLPQFNGAHSTAGIPLDKSLALVSILDAMVTVDSAFTHAASAFDIPLIGLFGPTDGRPMTRHHKYRHIVWKPEQFACIPCWRNEDLPCAVTGGMSVSPCIAAISAEEILDNVKTGLQRRARRL